MSHTSSDHSIAFPLRQKSKLRHLAQELLAKADIRIDGDRPWDMRILKEGVLERILGEGSLGLGESYMDGEWDAERVDEFVYHLIRAQLDREVRPWNLILHGLRYRLFNMQSLRRAWMIGQRHYDLGNDLYEAMLDPLMTYSCGYWKTATHLAAAQEAKLELICRKLQLKPGMRLLDIGCGWGSLMAYAAQHYGVECVGVTVSEEQVKWARHQYKGLPVEFRLQDYRTLDEQFDCIASVGMFEHVGHKNYREFMQVAHRCLDDGGLFLLHSIGNNSRDSGSDPWIDKYIFPNGELPSVGQIGDAADDLFVIEDLHNFGADYDKTLMAWHANFEAAWPKLAYLGERFRRMWTYYLLSCAGTFRARDIQLWQWVLSKRGVQSGYIRPYF